MDFVANREKQVKEMLQTLGIGSIDELFCEIPASIRCAAPRVDDGLSEYEGMRWMESLGNRNSFVACDNYLGAGTYEHHVPALVAAICQKSEFLTAYTPYQAEASQGMLQVIFEFQSAVCALTGLDVANASLYDGASACGEALLMALRLQPGRRQLVVHQGLHPHYRGVVDTYLAYQDVDYRSTINEHTAAVLVQYPNVHGIVEDLAPLAAECKAAGALLIVCANPLVYGLYRSAGELGADIAVGDLQPLGIPMQFGGPHCGYIACRDKLVRQVPGRIVGETLDGKGRWGFVLTLQAREQHIRREKATSNICSNQALAALASLVAILWYGPEGLRKLAETNFRRASYLRAGLTSLKGVHSLDGGAILNEFAIRFDKPIDPILAHFRKRGIEPGVSLRQLDPSQPDALLVAVTETKSREQLDRYLAVAKEAV